MLDALNRLTTRKIDWCYRFASYHVLSSTPHHVFIVVNDEGREIWIDPTPGAKTSVPVWQIDKKTKIDNMALARNISGVGGTPQNAGAAVGMGVMNVQPKIDGDNNLNWDGHNRYAGVFDPYLGLSRYADVGGASFLTDWNGLTRVINELIAQGPHPGHAVNTDFVRWIYTQNLRSWNFNYPGGVRPGFSAADLLPANWPRLILTPDGRLTLSDTQAIDDYQNAEIHLLTAWAQDLINRYDSSPYPVKPDHLKRFSQGKEGSPDTRNLFNEARGDSIFKQIGTAIMNSLEWVKEGVLKIIGSIPRNAFLALVGMNVFNFAGNLMEKIDSGEWERIARKWESLGGNPDKLRNTISDGAKKPAVLGCAAIGAEPATTATALLAAAAPIIAAMLSFLNKDGKLNDVIAATKSALNAAFPNESFDFLDGVFVNTRTGQPIEWAVDPQDNELLGGGNNDLPGGSISDFMKQNPLIIAAAGGLGAHLLVNKKGKKPNYLIPALAAAGLYFILNGSGRPAPKQIL